MNTKIHKTLIFLVVISLFACNDELNLEPLSYTSIDNFYKTESEIEQALSGAYSALQTESQYGTYYIYYSEIRSDNTDMEDLTVNAGRDAAFDLFELLPSNSNLNDTWVSYYKGINNCNIILDRIDAISQWSDAAVKNQFKGEALFIRALTYFNLVRIWGDVPLIVTEVKDPFDALNHTRTITSEVYAQIVADLNEAVNFLPEKDNVELGRATRGAAQALLGKVYLNQKDYQNSADQLKAVIISGQYNLLTNFGDVFSIDNEDNDELIFEVQYKSGGLGEGSSFAGYYAPKNDHSMIGGIGVGYGGNNRPTQELYNLYNSNDVRRNFTIGVSDYGTYYAKKYMENLTSATDGDKNFTVLRYADVLLMYAEALNEIGYNANGDALKYLNEVRERAGLSALTSVDLPDQASFRTAIAKERRLELATEGHRWFDLVRTGLAVTTMNGKIDSEGDVISIDEHNLLYPIPQTQIDASGGKITPNPGYN